jgi:hypothetical protein
MGSVHNDFTFWVCHGLSGNEIKVGLVGSDFNRVDQLVLQWRLYHFLPPLDVADHHNTLDLVWVAQKINSRVKSVKQPVAPERWGRAFPNPLVGRRKWVLPNPASSLKDGKTGLYHGAGSFEVKPAM